jgi:hypothetical protein
MLLKCVVFIALLVSGVAALGQKQSAPTNPAPQATVAAPQHPPQHWYLRPEWVSVIITGLYVFIAGLTLLAIRRQGKLMAAQAESMSNQTDRMSSQVDLMEKQTSIALESVKVAKKAADAAKESADVATAQTKAMTDRERARLYVDTPPIPIGANLGLAQSQNIAGFRLTIRNVAPTPAINVSGLYSAIATEFQTPPGKARDIPMEIHEVVEGQGKVESEVLIYAAFPQPEPKFAPLAFWCHVWGVIEYNDVLTEERHSTRFRFCVLMRQRPNGGASSEGQWQKCGMHEDNKAA